MKPSNLVLLIDPGGGRGLSAELEQVMELARKLGARLEAILLTDDELLRAARLPMTKEVGLSSAKTLPFEVNELEDQLDNLKKEIERRLASASRDLDVPWTLAVRSGPIRKQLVVSENAADWLALMGTGISPRSIFRHLAAEPGFPRRKVIITCAVRNMPFHRGITAVVAFGKLSRPVADLCRSFSGWLTSSDKLAFFSGSSIDDIECRPDDIQHRLTPGNWDAESLLEQIELAGAEALILVPDPDSGEPQREALKRLVEMASVPVVILTGKENSSSGSEQQ